MGYDYLVWGSRIGEWDYCPIKARLKTKEGVKIEIDSEKAFNFLKHDIFEEMYIKKWDVIKKEEKITPEELKEYTISKIDDVILKKWDGTIWPALRMDSKEMNRGDYSEKVKEKIEKNLDEICENVVKHINKEVKVDYIAECKKLDILKDLDNGIGARPDFVLCFGDKVLRVADVKKVNEDYMRGMQLQNTAGYLIVEKNKRNLARQFGVDSETVVVDRTTIFEDYNTGNEIFYSITDEDMQEVINIASKIRCDILPKKYDICYESKESSCDVKNKCIEQYGSIEENFQL